jgi:hypothetical protein
MNKAHETVQDYLPDSIKYLMTIISIDSTLLLIKRYGGIYLDIPVTAKPSHPIAKLIGIDDFKKLTHEFAYTRLEIPSCYRLISLMRAFSILQEKRNGDSNRTLALKYGISDRAVRLALKKAEAVGKTLTDEDITLKFRELFL